MEDSGLYIHVPFCRSKCPYCGFYSIASRSLVQRWLEAVKQEMGLWKDGFHRFDTLYLGGGTPSVLKKDELRALMDRARSCFSLAADAEISIEANPGDLTPRKAFLLRDLGFNRVTVGVQSFDDGVLSFLGRRHRADDAMASISNLRDAGFENVGVDLMYGVVGQSPASWRATLKQALAVSPEHISCYQLTIEEKTPFRRRLDRGELRLIGERMERAFFVATSRFLEARGYVHYEISNFAKSERFESRHNRKYWRRVPYLGLGPSAHSFDGKRRWWNVSSVRRYCDRLETGESALAGGETLTREQTDMERISLGLRMKEGVDMGPMRHALISDESLAQLRERGWVRLEGDRVIPTRRGYAVADALARCFF
jgi:oxygen-independent coproporphyrinogen-3 oxidase